ncbi:MAG TPA: response regulator [Candidatus Dormibacteraeota bacterium]|jgi:PAS domain S-box-containing protein
MHGDDHYRRLVQRVRECAIFSLDSQGRVTSWNLGAELIHGHAADDILGQPFSRLFTDADSRVGNPERLLGSVRVKGSASEEGWLVRADGSRFWADIVLTPLEEKDSVAGYAVVVRDVSHRKAAIDELQEVNNRLSDASRLKSDFLAKMSHELRTPLTAMLGFSDVLLKGLDGELSPIQQEDVSRIKRSGLSILELINDILDLSKIESGRMTLHVQTVDMVQLTNNVVANLGQLAEDKGLYLVTDFPDQSLEVAADPMRANQVMTNLLGNAIKFTETGGVTVRGTLQPREVRIEVSDTGVGIAPEAVGVIWDEFRQGHTGALSHSGTGLGLAISRRLVNMQGGSIGVESKPDGGSCFWFTLPRPKGAPPVERRQRITAEAPAPGSVATPAESRELILVVEDDEATRRLISRRLKGAGFRTVEASGGAQAISAARELLPAVITLDMVMPTVDGWTVLAALRDDPRTKDIPVIVASIVDNRELAMSLGAADFVPKPFSVDYLLSVVERLVPGGATRVLVVDDHDETREAMRRILVGAGMEVEVAGGGEQALDLALRKDHDLVVTDLMMPEMSGFELIFRLRADARTKDVPIVVITGKDLTDDDRSSLGGQIQSLLAKAEFGPADLVTTVRRTLRERATVSPS